MFEPKVYFYLISVENFKIVSGEKFLTKKLIALFKGREFFGIASSDLFN